MGKRRRASLSFLPLFLVLAAVMVVWDMPVPGVKAAAQADSITKTFQVLASQQDWSQFWTAFRSHVEWSFERNEGAGWIETSGLTINRVYPEPNKVKIALVFDAPVTADYRLTVAFNKTLLNYIHGTNSFNYTLQYGEYEVVFDWSDLKDVNGLVFNHGTLDGLFWWRVRRDNVPLGAHVDLDPTWQVSAETDDAEGYETGAVHPPWDNLRVTGDPLVIGMTGGVYIGPAMRFQAVSIPHDAQIVSAYLTFHSWSSSVSTGTFGTYLHGQDSNDASTFTTVVDFNSRPRTTAGVTWVMSTTWVPETDYDSPDISTIIQEIVDRGGWSSGNDMVIFWRNDILTDDGDYRRFYSYGGDSAKAAKLTVTYTYNAFNFYGVYDEDTGFLMDASERAVNVTAYFIDQSIFTFELNGSYGYLPSFTPVYFYFDLTSPREYWLSDGETAAEIYVFDKATTVLYTITFLDQAGVLDTYPFVEARRYVNGTSHVIEKRKADTQKKVVMSLINGQTYDIVISNGLSYTFGDLLMTSDLSVLLLLKGLEFPDHISLGFQYLRIFATRSADGTDIVITYEDRVAATIGVVITVYFQSNDSVAWSTSETADSFVATWTGANNITDYWAEAIITHSTYGILEYTQVLVGLLGGITPWNIDFFGTLPFETSYIIPSIIILFAAAIFSALSVRLGLLVIVVLAIFFAWWQWLPIATDVLIFAFGLVIIGAIALGRRRIAV